MAKAVSNLIRWTGRGFETDRLLRRNTGNLGRENWSAYVKLNPMLGLIELFSSKMSKGHGDV